MAVHEIYSKRQMRLRGEISDVYQYEDIPYKLRIQLSKLYGEYLKYNTKEMDIIYKSAYEILTMEYGVESLNHNYNELNIHSSVSFETQKLISFVKCDSNTDCFLDVLELVMQMIRDSINRGRRIIISIIDEVNEINIRFRESAVGYQLDPDSLTIIRVDSQFVHSEVVKPTLSLLNADPAYVGVLDEFMQAHEHYRHRNYKDAILNCGKSFESMLKAIHEKRVWAYDKNKDTANKLILSCVDKGLFPSFQQDQLMQVGKILECGVPTIRNKTAGHGQGHEVTEVPEHLVSYVIHLTASNLLFLAKADEHLP